MNAEEKAEIILSRLGDAYGTPECALHYRTTFELLISVILSAQCTDKRVNVVTEYLFAVADTPVKMLALGLEALENQIFSVGFYHAKARNIMNCCAELIARYDGQVPSERAALKTLAGVGDKTASVVYAVGFGGQAIPVDTHVGRLTRRLGLSQETNPTYVMHELENIVPVNAQTHFHHLLITHGRNVCASQRPKCEQCILADICSYRNPYKEIKNV